MVSISGQYCQGGLQLVSSVNLPVKGHQSLSLVKSVVQIDLPLQANPLIMINFSPKFYYHKCWYDQHWPLMVQSQFSRISCLCFLQWICSFAPASFDLVFCCSASFQLWHLWNIENTKGSAFSQLCVSVSWGSWKHKMHLSRYRQGFVLQISGGECVSVIYGNRAETTVLINQISNRCAQRMNSTIFFFLLENALNNNKWNCPREAQVGCSVICFLKGRKKPDIPDYTSNNT